MAAGSSISTSSTLNSSPSGVFQTLPGLKPLLARMIGPQPAHTFKANRTVLSFHRLVGRGALDLRQPLGRLEGVVLHGGGRRRRVVGQFGLARRAPGAGSRIRRPGVWNRVAGAGF